MNSEDGQVFIKNLASFVRTHERALANALQLQRSKNGHTQATAGAASISSSSSVSSSLAKALSRPYTGFPNNNIKPAKLALTPHHLFYLLTKFEDLGVDVGPTTVRLENLHSTAAPSNYVSFLGHAPKSRGRQSDEASLKSVSSVRSAISSVSSLWSTFSLTNSAAKEEKRMVQHRDDIKYLYSSFTKIPALKLSPDRHVRMISGYEEFPFDTAVPLFVFKNLSVLEICELDFKQMFGWDRLAEQLRSLTVKRAHLSDPLDLLQNIVLDDIEKRRKRSSKTQLPGTPPSSALGWPSNSPRSSRHMELARSFSSPTSPIVDQRRGSLGNPLLRGGSSDGTKTPIQHSRQRSKSPVRVLPSRHGSLHKSRKSTLPVHRRSSGSSGSETHEAPPTPRRSTPDLLASGLLPSSKWRFLRHLSIAENGLISLTAESLRPVASTLQSLDLSGNLFTEIPDALASLTHLRALNLSNCMIDSLQSLSRYPLPAITTLNVRSNRLLSLAGIERIRTLERVDLRDNKLYDPTELRRLTGAMDLVEVYVQRNPFTRSHQGYRLVIFNAFRDTPGHPAQVTIDTLGPTYNEKKQLHDKAPEPMTIPVIQPPPEDDYASEATAVAETDSSEIGESSLDYQVGARGHRRATSDMGPATMGRRKKGPRRRIVELSQELAQQQASLSSSPIEPSLLHTAELPPQTPTEVDEPTTPEPTPYHTAPTTRVPTVTLQRPTLDTAFTTPTPSPKIRSASDDDDSPVASPEGVNSNSELYGQKIETLKSDLGPTWLSGLDGDRFVEQRNRNRSCSPTPRPSGDHSEKQTRGVSPGVNTLG